MKQNEIKGYFYALLATLAFSNVYIFSKAALNEVHLAQFGVFWFAFGTFLNLAYGVIRGRLKPLLHLTKPTIKILLILGGLEILTSTTFFISVNIIEDPSVTSFLGNMYPVMVTLGGIFILKERFGLLEILGIILALVGTFIISYTGDFKNGLFIKGTGIVLINAIIAASSTLVVRKHVNRISPEVLNFNRTLWMLFYSLIMFFVFKQSFSIPTTALYNIAIGSILGPFLAILTLYYSLKYIEASRSSIIQSLKGIFVLLGSYIFFKTLPLPHQIWGGLITVIGVLLMTLAQSGYLKVSKKHNSK